MPVKQRGFTLIEVLVTLVILMIGLLGLAGLMVKGQKASYEAYQRHQALTLANDMAERIRANRTQAASYAAGAPLKAPLGEATLASTDCSAGCAPAALVDYDLALWDGLLNGIAERRRTGGAARSVGGIINARGCIEPLAALPNTFRVSVAWQGDQRTVAPASSACGTGLYGDERLRRVVSLDVMQ